MGNSNGMLGGNGVLGSYEKSEEADSNRPITGIAPNQMGLLEQMGIYSPAQKQAMQFAQENAQKLMQRESDMQEAQMSTGLAAPAFYGIQSGRQLGGMLGNLAGGGQQAAQQSLQPQGAPTDPAYQMVQSIMSTATDPEDALGKMTQAGQQLMQNGNVSAGIKMLAYAQKQQQELAESKAKIADQTAAARSANATADKTIADNADPSRGKIGEITTDIAKDGSTQHKVFTGMVDGKPTFALVGPGGIPASKVSQTTFDGDNPIQKNDASKAMEGVNTQMTGAANALGVVNQWEDNVKKDPGSLGFSGKVAEFLTNAAANTTGLLNLAKTAGKTVDPSVLSAIQNPMQYSRQLHDAGIDAAKNGAYAITLAYYLATQGQKSANNISDKDIEYQLKRIGASSSDPATRLALAKDLRGQIYSGVENSTRFQRGPAGPKGQEGKRFFDMDSVQQGLGDLRKLAGIQDKYSRGDVIPAKNGSKHKFLGGDWHNQLNYEEQP